MALGKILVVDDDKNICELLRLYLEKEGYSVILAHDGEEALLKFDTLHPELILLCLLYTSIRKLLGQRAPRPRLGGLDRFQNLCF